MDEWVNETSNKSMTWYAKQKRKPFCVSLMFSSAVASTALRRVTTTMKFLFFVGCCTCGH